MGMYCCVICFGVGTTDEEDSSTAAGGVLNSSDSEKNRKLFGRFFTLLERHLNGDNNGGMGGDCVGIDGFSKTKTAFFDFTNQSAKLPACEDCLVLLTSFCELYHQIKHLELQLNGKMCTVMNTMFCAQRVPSRMSAFQDTAKKEMEREGSLERRSSYGSEEVVEMILQYRKLLIKKCSTKLVKAHPRLILKRLPPQQPQQETEPGLPEVHESSSNITPADSDDDESITTTAAAKLLLNDVPERFASLLLTGSNKLATAHTPPILKRLMLQPLPQQETEPVVQQSSAINIISVDDQSITTTTTPIAAAAKLPLIKPPVGEDPIQDDNPTSPSSDSDHFAEELHFVDDNDVMGDILRSLLVEDACEAMDLPQATSAGESILSENEGVENSLRDATGIQLKMEVLEREAATTASASSPTFEPDNNFIDDEHISNEMPVTEATTTNGTHVEMKLPIAWIKEEASKARNLPTPQKVRAPKEEVITRTRGLRTMHRCKTCQKTFSNSENLSEHQKSKVCGDSNSESSNDESEMSYEEEDIETESSRSEDDDDDSSAVPSDHENLVEAKTEVTSKPISSVSGANLSSLRSGRQFYKAACPDCNELFLTIHKMILHRKNTHQWQQSATASAPATLSTEIESIIVDNNNEGAPTETPAAAPTEKIKTVLVELMKKAEPNPDAKTEDIVEDYGNFQVHSKIRIPDGDIFVCPEQDCQQIFFSKEDLDTHSKLHCQYPCQFVPCNFLGNPADLVEHELTRHSEKASSLRELLLKNESNSCSRCNEADSFPGKLRLKHFITSHLNIKFMEEGCPICKIPFSVESRYQFYHFNLDHNLMGLDNKDEEKVKIINCPEENCPSYHLSSRLLKRHLEVVHGKNLQKESAADVDDEKRKSKDKLIAKGIFRIVCPDCKQLFREFHDMFSHRQEAHPTASASIDGTSANSSEGTGNNKDNNTYVEIVKFTEQPTSTCLNRIRNQEFHVYTKIPLPKEIFSCPEEKCKQIFFFKEDLEETHLKLHGEFKCEFCDFVGNYAISLAEHELEQHQKGARREKGAQYSCPRCDFRHGYKSGYLQHYLTIHLNLERMEQGCPICRVHFFSGWREDFGHLKYHHNLEGMKTEELYKCSEANCTAYYLQLKQLRNHFRWSHANAVEKEDAYKIYRKFEGEVKCKDCGKGFKGLKNLKSHRVRYHPALMMSCTFEGCHLKYDTQEGLQRHLKMHNNDSVWDIKMCTKCGKTMLGKLALQQHLQAHEKKEKIESGEISEPTWVCELCAKVFKTKVRLEQHLLHHAGPESWKFSCEICGVKAKHEFFLKQHMRVHTGERPYVCSVCGNAYSHRHNLRIHINSKHGDVVQDIPRKIDTTNNKRGNTTWSSTNGPQQKRRKRNRGKQNTSGTAIVEENDDNHLTELEGNSEQSSTIQ